MLSSAFILRKLRRQAKPNLSSIKQEQRLYQQYAKTFNLLRYNLRNEVEIDQELENIKMVIETVEADIDTIIESIPDAYAHLVSGDAVEAGETSK